MKLPLILLFSGISILSAQQVPPVSAAPVPKQFHKLDKDGDGRLSLDEFKAVGKDPAKREKRFRKLDTNNDGFVSADEFAAGMAARKK
jgi:Ca2+-binding EF-hand superfamily protein